VHQLRRGEAADNGEMAETGATRHAHAAGGDPGMCGHLGAIRIAHYAEVEGIGHAVETRQHAGGDRLREAVGFLRRAAGRQLYGPGDQTCARFLRAGYQWHPGCRANTPPQVRRQTAERLRRPKSPVVAASN